MDGVFHTIISVLTRPLPEGTVPFGLQCALCGLVKKQNVPFALDYF